jgi:hypothetical protein
MVSRARVLRVVRLAVVPLAVAALAGCGGGPIVDQDEALEIGGIEYRVLRARALPGTSPTVVTVTLRATNLSGVARELHGTERSSNVFIVLSEGRRIETTGTPSRARLGAGETITFTLRAEPGNTKDLALRLLGSNRYPLSGNLGQIELRDFREPSG